MTTVRPLAPRLTWVARLAGDAGPHGLFAWVFWSAAPHGPPEKQGVAYTLAIAFTLLAAYLALRAVYRSLPILLLDGRVKLMGTLPLSRHPPTRVLIRHDHGHWCVTELLCGRRAIHLFKHHDHPEDRRIAKETADRLGVLSFREMGGRRPKRL
ncbi:hypothetical protein OOT46_09230 [Aquabacterium sp. A7-Y]|uniref:hypothetical protein n=1 Tax=Aquabacterium sp. A7-Y TaxID=1349605 RepID=UPI00223E6032|nr:hypothetical protein [Aquabacterium sp. A7-Y]MCW7538028.1 hypothetical protein [Aquabacterium sp. A7-Y]